MSCESKKTILFFLFGGAGGAERMTVNIGKMMPVDKYNTVFVICGKLREIEAFIPESYETIRIPWINIHVFPHLRLWFVITRLKPDYVFCSTMSLNIITAQTAFISGVKCVLRNDNMLEYVAPSLRRKIKRWYPTASRVVAQQEEMASQLASLGIPQHKIAVLHNAIDEDTIHRKLENADDPFPQNNNIRYLCLNTFSSIKAQDVTMKAFIEVHRQKPNSELYFVGLITNDPIVQEVKHLIEENSMEDCVHITGFSDNPYKWLKNADCIVSTSRMEGLPNALIEGQFLGTPAVATRCIPMIGRIISNGKTGYTVPVDDIIAISNAMIAAPALGRIKMTYRPSPKEDFVRLFSNEQPHPFN